MKMTLVHDDWMQSYSGDAQHLCKSLEDFWAKVKQAPVPDELSKELMFTFMEAKNTSMEYDGVKILLS